MRLTQDDIQKRLPHTEPFLFIQGAEIISNEEVKCVCTLGENHFIFQGHFPNNPILPGVIVMEMVAQSGAVIICDEYLRHGVNPLDFNPKTFFVKVNGFSFKNPIAPNTEININSIVKKMAMENFYSIKSKVFTGDTLCASGDIIVYFKCDFIL